MVKMIQWFGVVEVLMVGTLFASFLLRQNLTVEIQWYSEKMHHPSRGNPLPPHQVWGPKQPFHLSI